jgi:hypothetical protein
MENANELNSTTKSYAEMAVDQQREREAEEWSEALIGDDYVDVRMGRFAQGRNNRL